MSDCERYEAMISALLDGELSPEEEAEVRAHMASCPDCAAMYAAFAAVGTAVREQDVPDTLHKGIMDTVRAAETARRTQSRIIRLRAILTAAACLIVVVGTVFALKNNARLGANSSKSAEAPMAAKAASVPEATAMPESPEEAQPLYESKMAAPAAPKDAPMAEPRAEADLGGTYTYDAAVPETAGTTNASIWDTPECADWLAENEKWDNWMKENDWNSCVMVNDVIYEFSRGEPAELFHSDGLPEGCEYYGEVIQLDLPTTPEDLWPKANRELSYSPLRRVEGQIYTVPGNPDVVYLDIDIFGKVGDPVRSLVIRCDRRE